MEIKGNILLSEYLIKIKSLETNQCSSQIIKGALFEKLKDYLKLLSGIPSEYSKEEIFGLKEYFMDELGEDFNPRYFSIIRLLLPEGAELECRVYIIEKTRII